MLPPNERGELGREIIQACVEGFQGRKVSWQARHYSPDKYVPGE